jgi:hypothetical protein
MVKGKAVPQHTCGGAGGTGLTVSVTPRPSFTSVERTPGTHCTGGWVCPRPSIESEVRDKISCPCRGPILNRKVVQCVARHYTD